MRLQPAAALLLACALSGGARAEDPLNSSDKPVNADTSAAGAGTPGATHNEFNVLPIAGGTTDIGFGGGFFSNFTHLQTGLDPYVWNIESVGLITFKVSGGRVIVPYTDVYLKLGIPRLFGHPLRLEVRPSFTAETTIHYYGLGNASPAHAIAGKADTWLEYGRTHPQLDVDLRFRIVDHVSARGGARYVQNWIQTQADSKLASDLTSGSDEVRRLLGSTAPHAVLLLKTGLQWDDRDNEASTRSGSLHSFDLRFSPGGGDAFPYRYGEALLNLRVFVPLVTSLTLAVRLAGQILFGDVPFYELARFDDSYALGGPYGVRGIPAGRFAGKVKLLGNLELRDELLTFHALGKPLLLGAVAFADGGRLWTDFGAHPELDGTGLGLHFGLGGGLRLQSGSAFVLRIDVAWSPDADPIGGYFSAGQLF